METKQVVSALSALAQETRLAIFRLLVESGPTGRSVSEIGEAVKAAPTTLSFHLKELTHAGLIESRQAGRYIFYSANFKNMSEVLSFLTENCCERDGSTCDIGGTRTVCKPSKAESRVKVKATTRRKS